LRDGFLILLLLAEEQARRFAKPTARTLFGFSSLLLLCKNTNKKIPPRGHLFICSPGGGTGIRTLGAVAGTLVFKTSAFDRSAIPPAAPSYRYFKKDARINLHFSFEVSTMHELFDF
jgi:hypothetical protein